MNNRVIMIAVVILAMLAMWQVGQVIGQRVKGAPKPMNSLKLPTTDGEPERVIDITAQMKVMPNAQVFATVSEGKQVLFDSVPFAMANYMDTPPVFTVLHHGDLAAVSTELYPEYLLAFVDFESKTIWPHPAEGKPFRADDPDALALLATFKEAGLAPENAQLLPTGYMPLNNDRLREQHEAAQANP